jgi:hypothetical protein
MVLFLRFGRHNVTWAAFSELNVLLVHSAFNETLRRTTGLPAKGQDSLKGSPFVLLRKIRDTGASYATLSNGNEEKFMGEAFSFAHDFLDSPRGDCV